MEIIIIVGVILIILCCALFSKKENKEKTNKDKKIKNKKEEINNEENEFKKRKSIIEENKTKVVKIYNVEVPILVESTIYNEEDEEIQNEYKSEEIANWISDEDIETLKWSWYSSEIYTYINNEKLKNKINDITLDIDKKGFARIKIYAYEELTEKEKEEMLEFLKGQFSDGWGEENYDFTKEDDTEYVVEFWNNDKDWYIKYVE